MKHTWKKWAIIFTSLDIFYLGAAINDYYEFFIKECRDAFPFGYCPWGGESMGPTWETPELYLHILIINFIILGMMLCPSIYFMIKRQYKRSFIFSVTALLLCFVYNWWGYQYL